MSKKKFEKHFVGKSYYFENPSAFDKDEYDQNLALLQQELSDISEILKIRHKYNVDFKLCLDFDVIRSALDWTEDKNSGSIWSSIVLNHTHSNVMMLPGTLSELIKYVSYRRRLANRKATTQIGSQFVKLISGEDIDTILTLDETYRSSLKAFVKSALGDKTFFLLKKIRDKFLPMPVVSDVGALRKHFARSLRFLSEMPLRESKEDNNQIDALNFAIIKEHNSQKKHDRCILISETKVMHALGATWKEAYFDESQTYSSVWSSRKAAIYLLLLQKEGTVAGAEREAWNIIQEILDLRRNLKFPKCDKKMDVWSTDIAPRSELLGALTSFEELFKFIKNDKSIVDAIYVDESVQYSLSNQKEFFEKFEDFLRENLKLAQYRQALDLVNKATTIIHKMEVVDHGSSKNLGYLYKREFLINGALVCTKAEYTERILWIVESNAPLVEFIKTVNNIRSEIRSRISTKKISIPNPEDNLYELTIKAGHEFKTINCKLGGRQLALAGVKFAGNQIHNTNIAELRSLFEQSDPIEYKFFRIDSEFFSASYEGRYKLFNIDKKLIQMTNFFVQELASPEASQYDFENEKAVRKKTGK